VLRDNSSSTLLRTRHGPSVRAFAVTAASSSVAARALSPCCNACARAASRASTPTHSNSAETPPVDSSTSVRRISAASGCPRSSSTRIPSAAACCCTETGCSDVLRASRSCIAVE
jgi:hypothetical protein